jgi:hypothetical protein
MKYLKIIVILGSVFFLVAMSFKNEEMSNDSPKKQNDTLKTDSASGFIIAPNYELVVAHCTGCHSSKVVMQYNGNRQDWLTKIRWMQATQNLWDLGETEPLVLDYLSRYYSANKTEKSNRRKPLEKTTWYNLTTTN